jgi:hypothetical protein
MGNYYFERVTRNNKTMRKGQDRAVAMGLLASSLLLAEVIF